MIRILLNGAAGHMGKEVENSVAKDPDLSIVARVDVSGNDGCLTSPDQFTGEADVIIDFSHHTATPAIAAYAAERKIPALIATTGQTPEEEKAIADAAKQTAIFRSANMSVGVALLCELAKKAAAGMPDADIEIVETHHNRKVDAPSGTALMIAKAVQKVRDAARFVTHREGKREKDEIGIHSVRRGNVVGIHEIFISTESETLILRHEAQSRSLFADGAVAAAKFLAGKPSGMYSMEDMIR